MRGTILEACEPVALILLPHFAIVCPKDAIRQTGRTPIESGLIQPKGDLRSHPECQARMLVDVQRISGGHRLNRVAPLVWRML